MANSATAVAVVCFGVLSSVFYAVGLAWPLHMVSFYRGHHRVATVELYTAWARPFDMDALERMLPQRNNTEFRRQARRLLMYKRGTFGLETVRDDFCSFHMARFWPQFCAGLEQAIPVGASLLSVVMINGIILQGIGCALVLAYASSLKPSRNALLAAAVVLVAGVCLVFGTALLHLFLVGFRLNGFVRDSPGAALHAFFSQKVGNLSLGSLGNEFIWLGVLAQILQLVAWCFLRSPYEQLSAQSLLMPQGCADHEYGAVDGQVRWPSQVCRGQVVMFTPFAATPVVGMLKAPSPANSVALGLIKEAEAHVPMAEPEMPRNWADPTPPDEIGGGGAATDGSGVGQQP